MPVRISSLHSTKQRVSSRARQRGYIVIMFSLSLVMLLGVSGLAIDVGRMYLAKSEAQNFADVAALNALVKLAVTPTAFAAASAAAAQTNKKWQFGTTAFTNVATTFGTSPTDPAFTATPPATGKQASDYRYALVRVQVSVPMYLLGAVIGSRSATVAAQAMAETKLTTHLPGGEFPFSPWSRKNASPDDADDPFGFRVGNQYTLRWSPPGDKTSCGTDEGNVGANGNFRGYCCTGDQSVPSLRDVLAGGGTVPISAGDPFGPLTANGEMTTIDIDDWIEADTDRLSANYTTYRNNTLNPGNGKRLVIVPVNDNLQTVVGFAAFFLLPANQYSGKNWCAEYVGAMVQGVSGKPPASGHGVYHLRLVR